MANVNVFNKTISFRLCILVSCYLLSGFVAQCQQNGRIADPMEIDQTWEKAIRQVLLNQSNSTENNGTELNSDSTNSMDNIALDNNSDNNTELGPLLSTNNEDKLVEKELEEDEEGDEDYPKQSKSENVPVVSVSVPDSNVVAPGPSEVPDQTDYSDEEADEDGTDQSQTRQQMIRALAEDVVVNNPLLKFNFSKLAGLDEKTRIRDIWIQYLDLLESNNKQLMDAITPIGMDIFYQASSLSANCSNALLQFINALREQKPWALKMLESNGRLPNGLPGGSLSAFGNYDQCLGIDLADFSDEAGRLQFKGKYCLVELKLPVPSLKPDYRLDLTRNPINLTGTKYDRDQSPYIYDMVRMTAIGAYSGTGLTNAVCIPSACSAHEIQEIIDLLFGQNFSPKIGDCQIKEHLFESFSLDYTSYKTTLKFEIGSIFIVALCCLLVLIASILYQLETIFQRSLFKDGLIKTFIGAFSLQQNFQKLICTDATVQAVDLSFINGIRVFLMLWIIMAHVFSLGMLPLPEIVSRFEDELRPFFRSIWMQWIYNGFGSVHGFFFISGFILSFVGIRNKNVFKIPFKVTVTTTNRVNGETESINSQKFTILNDIIYLPKFSTYFSQRYFQFAVPMIGAFCFNFIWPMLGSGPFFEKISNRMLATCQNNWWRNLFLVNNFDKSTDICMIHTWFLSANFQLHLLAYPVIILLFNNAKNGIALLIVLIAMGMIVPGWLVYSHQINPTLNPMAQVFTEQYYNDLALVYYPFYNYLSCYFLGFLLGYILLKRLHRQFYDKNSKTLTTTTTKNGVNKKQTINNNNSIELQTRTNGFKDVPIDEEIGYPQNNEQTVPKPPLRSSFNVTVLMLSISLFVTVLNLLATFATFYWTKDDQPKTNLWLNAAYRALYPLLFIIAQLWLTVVCIYCPKNLINRFLSLGIFRVLSRLSFSFYMVHLFVVWYFFLQSRDLIRFTFFNLSFYTGGVLLYSSFLALLFELIFVSPFKSLHRSMRRNE